MNDAPTGAATISTKSGVEDGNVTFSRDDLIAGISDVDAGDTLTLGATIGAPTNGTAVKFGDGILYTPARDFFGNDSFTFTLSDAEGANITRTATVEIGAQPRRAMHVL